MVYWLLALPLQKGRKDATWETLQEKTSYGVQLSSNFKLDVPELRVGTLDTLLALSDDLIKISASVENVVGKIRRTVSDLAGAGAVAGLRVDNLPVDSYLTRFKWDEPKFPLRRPLNETVSKVAEVVLHLEDDLKVKVAEYNTVKGQVNAALRKAGGSLAVRDVATVVGPEQVIASENLTTLFVVVSKYAVKDWEANYEKICDFIVPRSTRLVAEDNDYAIMSVVLFRRVVDDFKAAARVKGFQVREYVPPPEVDAATLAAAPSSAEAIEALKREGEAKRVALEGWCKTAYGEAFGALVHLAVVRLFVESILRYGLPPAFLAAAVRPAPKMEARLRAVLASAFGSDAAYWRDDAAAASAGVVSELDAYPYVSITLHTE